MTAESSTSTARSVTPGGVLVVLGIVLLVGPALFPVQPVLYHDTSDRAIGNATELEAAGITIVAYENLSERGQQLYVASLRADGEYSVPVGAGAPEFAYPTPAELGAVEDYRQRQSMTRIAIERPPDADLPPADEPVQFAEDRVRNERERDRRSESDPEGDPEGERTGTPGTETGPTVEEMRQQIARYDLMSTRTDRPPLTASPNLLRLLSAVLGIVAVGTGGYLHSRP